MLNLLKKTRKFKKKVLNKSLPYNLSSRPQRYGPGMNRAVINQTKTCAPNYLGRFALQMLLNDNLEFSNKRKLFKYFKIIEIRATFLPANITGAFDNIPVMFSWWLTSVDTPKMYQDDSTKLVPVYRVKPRTLRFLPPRTVLDVQTISETSPVKFFDFSQFLSTDTTQNFPGWLYLYNTSSSTLYFSYEVVVLFRGNDNNPEPSSMLKEENPFVDKFFIQSSKDVGQPPGHNLDVIESEDEKDLEEKDVQNKVSEDVKKQIDEKSPNKQVNENEDKPPNKIEKYKSKIQKIMELQKKMDQIRFELENSQSETEEEEKDRDKEKEEKEDFLEGDISRKNKPK